MCRGVDEMRSSVRNVMMMVYVCGSVLHGLQRESERERERERCADDVRT